MRIGLIMGALGGADLNTRALDAARRYAGEGVTIEHLRIADLPAYTPCVDAPASAAAFRAEAAHMDGLVVLATQHLGGLSGAIKNALEWLGSGTSAIADLPVAVAGVASTPGSTFAAVQQLRTALTALGAIILRQPDYALEMTDEHFGDGSTIVDVTLADDLASFLAAARGFFAHEARAAAVDASLPPVATGGQAVVSLGSPSLASLANPLRSRA